MAHQARETLVVCLSLLLLSSFSWASAQSLTPSPSPSPVADGPASSCPRDTMTQAKECSGLLKIIRGSSVYPYKPRYCCRFYVGLTAEEAVNCLCVAINTKMNTQPGVVPSSTDLKKYLRLCRIPNPSDTAFTCPSA